MPQEADPIAALVKDPFVSGLSDPDEIPEKRRKSDALFRTAPGRRHLCNSRNIAGNGEPARRRTAQFHQPSPLSLKMPPRSRVGGFLETSPAKAQ